MCIKLGLASHKRFDFREYLCNCRLINIVSDAAITCCVNHFYEVLSELFNRPCD